MIQYLLRFCATGIFLVAAAAMFASELRSDPTYIFPLVTGFSILGFFLILLSESLGYAALGLGICAMPLFGGGALNTFVALWLFGVEVKALAFRSPDPERTTASERLLLLGFLALLLSLLGGMIQAFILEVDFLILSSLKSSGGLHGVFRYAVQSFNEWRGVPVLVIGYIVSALLAFSLMRSERDGEGRALEGLFSGLALGSVFAGIVFLIQFHGGPAIFSMNQNEFWQMTGRYSASFSDPNAFGIMTAILVPLLFLSGRGLRRWMFRLGSMLLVFGVPWSGSRTVWFGLALWLLLLFSRLLGGEEEQPALKRGGFLAAFVLFVGLAVAGYPPLNEKLQELTPASGLTRAVQTLNWEEGTQMLSSRVIYSRIAVEMWTNSPLVGVGLGRFYSLQDETARALGIELQGWRDNANNYYLQVLAEEGIIGVLLTLFAFFLFAQALTGRPYRGGWSEAERTLVSPIVLVLLSRIGMLVFALLLLTGPHLFFDEVRYLLTLLLVVGVSHVDSGKDSSVRSYRRSLLIATLIVPIVYSLALGSAGSATLNRGFYAKEHGEDGFFVWTSGKARLALCGPADRPALRFKALNPDLEQKPLRVQLSRMNGRVREPVSSFILTNTEWKEVLVDISSASMEEPEVLVIEVDRVWSPEQAQGVSDWRVLGVMLSWPENVC